MLYVDWYIVKSQMFITFVIARLNIYVVAIFGISYVVAIFALSYVVATWSPCCMFWTRYKKVHLTRWININSHVYYFLETRWILYNSTFTNCIEDRKKGLNNKQVLIGLLYWFDFYKLNQYMSQLIKVYCFNIY